VNHRPGARQPDRAADCQIFVGHNCRIAERHPCRGALHEEQARKLRLATVEGDSWRVSCISRASQQCHRPTKRWLVGLARTSCYSRHLSHPLRVLTPAQISTISVALEGTYKTLGRCPSSRYSGLVLFDGYGPRPYSLRTAIVSPQRGSPAFREIALFRLSAMSVQIGSRSILTRLVLKLRNGIRCWARFRWDRA
jgi:hypothetical protein